MGNTLERLEFAKPPTSLDTDGEYRRFLQTIDQLYRQDYPYLVKSTLDNNKGSSILLQFDPNEQFLVEYSFPGQNKLQVTKMEMTKMEMTKMDTPRPSGKKEIYYLSQENFLVFLEVNRLRANINRRKN